MGIEKLREIITSSDNIIFFGGAGVSTESNIPDFRSAGGLYSENTRNTYSPEEILSRSFFINHTEEFYEFYRDKMIYRYAKPNQAHLALAKLEEQGKLRGLITQNIDGLHQMAGSKNVFELHGSIHRNYCMKCRNFYDLDHIVSSSSLPKCTCGGTIKPDVVLYEEPLNQDLVEKSVRYLSEADVLIIGGTSLSVYPASGLIEYFKGRHLVLINKSPTSYDNRASVVINDSIGKTLQLACDNID